MAASRDCAGLGRQRRRWRTRRTGGGRTGCARSRGRVESFDTTSCTWQLLYTDGGNETVEVDVLNVRLARRYQHDHSADEEGATAWSGLG